MGMDLKLKSGRNNLILGNLEKIFLHHLMKINWLWYDTSTY